MQLHIDVSLGVNAHPIAGTAGSNPPWNADKALQPGPAPGLLPGSGTESVSPSTIAVRLRRMTEERDELQQELQVVNVLLIEDAD